MSEPTVNSEPDYQRATIEGEYEKIGEAFVTHRIHLNSLEAVRVLIARLKTCEEAMVRELDGRNP